jgi:hypothetical protein
MDRWDFFYKQLVSEADLDESNDWAENAERNFAIDAELTGIFSGGVATQHNPLGLIVDVSACVARDRLGRRLVWGGVEEIDVTEDEYAISTAPSSGYKKWVTVYAQFTRNLSAPETDGNGATVYTKQY